ncbi:hypothetical protein LXL04_020579 [Taraxacum kok-saghyz]
MNRVTKKVGKYEIGRTLGEGTFAKVKFAKNTETGEAVAVKIKREISIMKIVRHPNIVRLHEVHKGKLSEKEARGYFQQLIDAVSHCHSKGVFHRDLKLLEPDQLPFLNHNRRPQATRKCDSNNGCKYGFQFYVVFVSQADRADREAGSQADRADREGRRNNFCMIIMDFDTTTYKC